MDHRVVSPTAQASAGMRPDFYSMLLTSPASPSSELVVLVSVISIGPSEAVVLEEPSSELEAVPSVLATQGRVRPETYRSEPPVHSVHLSSELEEAPSLAELVPL